MATDPVRQHWVPKVYLRSFCVSPIDREQIRTLDLASGREFTTSISNVAVKRHYYTLDLRSGNPSYAVENALSKLESDVKPLLGELIETEMLFCEQSKRSLFATFLASLLMRSRQGLQAVKGHRDAVCSGEEMCAAGVPEKLAQQLQALDSEGVRELFAKSLESVTRPIATHLQSKTWSLIRADEDHFVTSENPLVVYHPSESRWGIATPGAHIHIPISPKLLLHIGDPETVPPGKTTRGLNKAGVRAINGLTILSAEQYLFSSSDFADVTDLVADRPTGSRRHFGPVYYRGNQ